MLAAVLPRVHRRVHTYGLSPQAEYRLVPLPRAHATKPGTPVALHTPDGLSRFHVAHAGKTLGPFTLHVPGTHNLRNATAAVAIALQLGIDEEKIAAGLDAFRGVDRRFQQKGVVRDVTVVDDYGHHPTEIRATLRAARECGFRRVLVLFQPHRYSRTRDLMGAFRDCFEDADQVWITDIYAASETPLPGVTAQALVTAIGRDTVHYAASFQQAVEQAVAMAMPGDLLLTLGAGNIHQAAPMALEALARQGQ
jgi:UDP-N-acetylmuramate--alanine ligase